MSTNFRKISKPSLIKKILLTVSLLTLTRIGNFVPLPYIDRDIFLSLSDTNNSQTSSLINLLNTFSGGAGSSFGLLTIGILPSINASIIMQVLTISVPSLEKLKKEEGLYGRRKLNDYTRYLTLLCALFQSYSLSNNLKSFVFNWSFWINLEIVLCLTAGSMIVLWISELITRNGIGNGSSLLICANIVSNLPQQLKALTLALEGKSLVTPILLVIVFFFTTFFCVIINEAKVEIPLISVTQLSQKMENERITQKNLLPLKVNQAGVLPLAFTSSLMVIFSSFLNFLSAKLKSQFLFLNLVNFFWIEKIVYWLIFGGLIFLSTYFYSTIVLDPKDIAKQFQKNSVIIRGILPGIKTKEYLTSTFKRLAALNAFFLLTIILFLNATQFWLGLESLNLRGFGLSSQIILVNAVIDTLQKVKSSFGQEELSEN